jgi:lipopolysaccharide/colanic/teichoic acid biosynthesis glycosyltransferase
MPSPTTTTHRTNDVLRCGSFLSCHALITACGFYAALLLTGVDPGGVDTRIALLLLVSLRVGAVLASGLHRWRIGGSATWELGWLLGAMLVASALFALAYPTLPASFYAVEFLVTTSLMAMFRCGPRLADDYERVLALRSPWSRALAAEGPRRALNVTVALLALVLTLPLWIVIALAIRLTSRGPVFYAQERVGLDLRASTPLASDPRRRLDLGGRPFMMIKFRTMTVDAEKETGAVWARKHDSRVTAVGRLLRHSRLDELPQLINVLRGDMNIVGPRPERPSIFAELREEIPYYAARQRARPGITGYAQVHLEADTSVSDVRTKLRYDLEYLTRQSVLADLFIMARTIPVMLFRDKLLDAGAHGGGGQSDGRPPPLGAAKVASLLRVAGKPAGDLSGATGGDHRTLAPPQQS